MDECLVRGLDYVKFDPNDLLPKPDKVRYHGKRPENAKTKSYSIADAKALFGAQKFCFISLSVVKLGKKLESFQIIRVVLVDMII